MKLKGGGQVSCKNFLNIKGFLKILNIKFLTLHIINYRRIKKCFPKNQET